MKELMNFCTNIQPTMLKVKNGEELMDHDRDRIVQFYLETCTCVRRDLAKIESKKNEKK